MGPFHSLMVLKTRRERERWRRDGIPWYS
jgi:hypothetical protein